MSKLVGFELFNFMSIEYAHLEFDDSNILNIKGYNDSGKSAILIALRVAMSDEFSTKQKQFIKNGKSSFKIILHFSDGVSITREKYLSGNSSYEMVHDGEILFTSKVGSANSKVRGVPDEIRTYLNLTPVGEGEYLNFQAIYDKKFLIQTSGSENVELLNQVLKLKETTLAINSIKHDMNVVVSNLNSTASRIEGVKSSIDGYTGLTDGLVAEVEKRVDYEKEVTGGAEAISGAIQKGKYFGGLSADGIKLDIIDTGKLATTYKALSGAVTLRGIPKPVRLYNVNPDRLRVLSSALAKSSSLENFGVSIPSVRVTDENPMMVLKKSLKFSKNLADTVVALVQVDSENKALKDDLALLNEEARSAGLDFVECGHCGEYVVVGGAGHV